MSTFATGHGHFGEGGRAGHFISPRNQPPGPNDRLVSSLQDEKIFIHLELYDAKAKKIKVYGTEENIQKAKRYFFMEYRGWEVTYRLSAKQ